MFKCPTIACGRDGIKHLAFLNNVGKFDIKYDQYGYYHCEDGPAFRFICNDMNGFCYCSHGRVSSINNQISVSYQKNGIYTSLRFYNGYLHSLYEPSEIILGSFSDVTNYRIIDKFHRINGPSSILYSGYCYYYYSFLNNRITIYSPIDCRSVWVKSFNY